jgi:hypothetical protein
MLKSLHQFCQDISGSIIMVKIKGKDNTFNKDVKVRSEKKCNMHCYGFWKIIYIIVMWLSINIALESLPIGGVPSDMTVESENDIFQFGHMKLYRLIYRLQ